MFMRHEDDNNERLKVGLQAPEVSVTPADAPGRRPSETFTVNRHLYRQIQQLEHMLISAADLQALLDILLRGLPRHFSLAASELWLFDPGQVVARLLDDSSRTWSNLQLLQETFDLDQLYDLDPDVTLIDATDPRMFEVLKVEEGIAYALLMPLLNEGQLIGSLHWGLTNDVLVTGDANGDMIAHLGSIISLCFQNAVNGQRLSRFNLIDPLTEVANRRGFDADMSREIDRARREQRPISLLLLEIDQYDDLHRYHGATTSEYVVRKLAERIASTLRSTDRLARISDAGLAVLLPGSGAVLADEVAQRMRSDVEDFQVDNGRGAVMHATLSVGAATWEPVRYPARDMQRLATQLEAAADKGLQTALQDHGNAVVTSRLGALII